MDSTLETGRSPVCGVESMAEKMNAGESGEGIMR
jgi:hypothetical protein